MSTLDSTTPATNQERATRIWKAWLILGYKAVDTFASNLLDWLWKFVGVFMAGLTIALSSAVAVLAIAAAGGDKAVTGLIVLATAVAWYTALDRFAKEEKAGAAIMGYMLYLSALVPVALASAVALANVGGNLEHLFILVFPPLLPLLFLAVVVYAILDTMAWLIDFVADSFSGQKDKGEQPPPPALVNFFRRVFRRPAPANQA